jgi:hypothetical protein
MTSCSTGSNGKGRGASNLNAGDQPAAARETIIHKAVAALPQIQSQKH